MKRPSMKYAIRGEDGVVTHKYAYDTSKEKRRKFPLESQAWGERICAQGPRNPEQQAIVDQGSNRW